MTMAVLGGAWSCWLRCPLLSRYIDIFPFHWVFLRSYGREQENINNNMSASVVRATIRAVSKRKLQPTRAALILTPPAVNKIKQLLADKPDHIGLKVAVRTRGCNGLSYYLEYAKSKGTSDEEVVQDGVRVFIEKKAQLTLLGTEMDYVEDKLSSEFVFNNPNIKGTCGCGESFNI